MEEGPGASSVSSDTDQRRYSWDERDRRICTFLARNEHAVYGPIDQRLITFWFMYNIKAGMRPSLD